MNNKQLNEINERIYINSPGNILQQIYILQKNRLINHKEANHLKQMVIEQTTQIQEIQRLFEQNHSLNFIKHHLLTISQKLPKKNLSTMKKQFSSNNFEIEDIQCVNSNSSEDDSFQINSLDNLSQKNDSIEKKQKTSSQKNFLNRYNNFRQQQNQATTQQQQYRKFNNQINTGYNSHDNCHIDSEEEDESDPTSEKDIKTIENIPILKQISTPNQNSVVRGQPIVRSSFYFQSVTNQDDTISQQGQNQPNQCTEQNEQQQQEKKTTTKESKKPIFNLEKWRQIKENQLKNNSSIQSMPSLEAFSPTNMCSSCDRFLKRSRRKKKKNLSVQIKNSNFKRCFNKSISYTALNTLL